MRETWREGPLRIGLTSVMLVIPLRVLSLGWEPRDDALRHAAKAVAQRPWRDILVLRAGETADDHPGWQTVIELVHRVTGAGTQALVAFAVVTLFVMYCATPVLVLRRPEAWIVVLLFASLADPLTSRRLFFGRTFLFDSTVVLLLGLLWFRQGGELTARAAGGFTLLIALAAWFHSSWYLLTLLPLVVALSGRVRLGLQLLLALGAGVLLAAVLSGDPVQLVWGNLRHGALVMASGATSRTLVGELQPYIGSFDLVIAAMLLCAQRAVSGRWTGAVIRNPPFLLAALGWVLGFHVFRFWSDWGLPALLAWAAVEMQRILDDVGWVTLRHRLALGAAAAAALFLVMTSNDLHAWSAPAAAPQSVLALPAAAWALPDAGGILYTNDMDVFYQVFPRLPHAPFRYIAGFETALMPEEDLVVYRRSLDSPSPEAFAPWVARMRAQDRLILRHEISQPPPVPGLEWKRVGGPLWSGRRAAAGGQR